MNSFISAAEMADMLHDRGNPWKALAMLHAYFDESGTHDAAPVAAIAGFVASADVWRALEAEWRDAMALPGMQGITWFHMTECMAGCKDFGGKSLAEREAIAAIFMGIIARHDVFPVWAGVNVAAFEHYTSVAFRHRYPKPYDLCFDEVFRQLAAWAARYARGSPVCTVFAEQTEYRARNVHAYQAWRSHPQAGEFLRALTYAFSKNVIPLQAADILAYEMVKGWEGREYGEMNFATSFQIRDNLEFLTKRHGAFAGGLYGAEGVRTAVGLFTRNGSL